MEPSQARRLDPETAAATNRRRRPGDKPYHQQRPEQSGSGPQIQLIPRWTAASPHLISRIHYGARLEESPHHLQVQSLCGQVEGCPPCLISAADGGALIDEEIHHGGILVPHRLPHTPQTQRREGEKQGKRGRDENKTEKEEGGEWVPLPLRMPLYPSVGPLSHLWSMGASGHN